MELANWRAARSVTALGTIGLGGVGAPGAAHPTSEAHATNTIDKLLAKNEWRDERNLKVKGDEAGARSIPGARSQDVAA
jgi:3-hydroxyisobutyrate dehydrogenase-like beta-hydroxyacid dehydrogenase